MILLEIGMILIGLIAVAYGVKVADEETPKADTMHLEVPQKELDAYHRKMKRDILKCVSIMENKKQEITEAAADEMSTISNEKIMGINEYSDQVIDKIEKNHAEVVFLYEMMQEKKPELLELFQNANVTKCEFQDEMAKAYQQTQQLLQEMQEERKECACLVKQMEACSSTMQSQMHITREQQDILQWMQQPDEEVAHQEEIPKELQFSSEQTDVVEELCETKEPILEQLQPEELDALKEGVEPKETIANNRNEEVLSLYQKGHSILEISKMLEMGQGEVQFVIDVCGR